MQMAILYILRQREELSAVSWCNTSTIACDAKDGPQLNFGFNDVDYPFNDGSYEASLRIGLPQLEKLKSLLMDILQGSSS